MGNILCSQAAMILSLALLSSLLNSMVNGARLGWWWWGGCTKWNSAPSSIDFHQEPVNVMLLGNRVFVDAITLKWKSYWTRIRTGPKSNDLFPYKKMEIWTQKRDLVEMEAEIGAMVPQAKIHLGPPGNWKRPGEILSEHQWRGMLPTPWVKGQQV